MCIYKFIETMVFFLTILATLSVTLYILGEN